MVWERVRLRYHGLALIILTLFCAGTSRADWFCTEGASQSRGATILSCGSGTALNLQAAKDAARDAAIAEFDAICRKSDSCNGYQVVVNPKRTECQISGTQHTCYRAIEFEIQKIRKESIIVDVDAVEEQLRLQRQELEDLNLRYEKLRQLEITSSEVQSRANEVAAIESKIALTEGREIVLSDMISQSSIETGEYRYTYLLFSNSFRVGANYFGSHLLSDDEVLFGLQFSYEHRPLRHLGFSVNYGFGADLSTGRIRSDGDIPRTGTANGTTNARGPISYQEVSIGTNIYTGFGGLYVKGEIGRNWAKQDQYRVDFGPLGTATTTEKSTVRNSQNFVSFGLGLDSRNDKKGFGGFVEVAGRKWLKGGSFGFLMSAGANFGF